MLSLKESHIISIIFFVFVLLSVDVQSSFAAQSVVENEVISLKAQPTEKDKLSENAPYELGPGDKISISVYGEPDLTDIYTVSNVGQISIPLIGSIDTTGLTVRGLEDVIEKKLRAGYLKFPSVSVQISQYRPFYIMGEVRMPGSYSFVSDMSVLNAVALAGGFTYRANRKNVEILRANHQISKLIHDIKVDERVKPGDVILVKERFF